MGIIEERRSIRVFSDKRIQKREICQILEAGLQAPSPKNRQPWEFIVITDEQKKKQLVSSMEREINILYQSKKERKDILKAFVYAMGMDTFVREPEEELDNRILWYFTSGSKMIPVRSKGRLIGNGYEDLFSSLRFNRRIKRYILNRSRVTMRDIKGYLDGDEMLDMIQDTWFIEDLVQSARSADDDEDENILDIFLKMYPNMDKGEWEKLFEGLQLVLFEFLEFMFDDNKRRINEAYQLILKRVYGYSKAGIKERTKKQLLQQGESIPQEFELTIAESKVRSHILDLLKQKYI